ncbi:phosphate ABC transporter permease PstA [Blastopirellula marina]|uniref:Phosphate transport system permease protein PstA n=1 Tax=Blastopirellula marina TaxID=124 RepID=A0A2S8G9J1_9BACT|nr:phosphate ABC transporter permease PstA [Blastopirellula marina]PQO41128.1 phosphate ABC transporter permease PtsA [Blastopirellula marina]PTL46004.1 phosphate ABC transporter permease PtsA [Blastopirellula marina]
MSAPPNDPSQLSEVDITRLARSLRKPRTLLSIFLSGTVTVATLMALVPLFSVIFMLFYRGASKLTWSNFTSLPPTAFEEGGGFGNALIGTIVMVGIAGLISVPFGIMAAIFLAELGPNSQTAKVVRFCAKVLSGFPSILAGVFTYGAVVLVTGGFSAYAGGVALSILMLPVVMLTAEEAIRMVPRKMKEASIGMGATQTQTLWYVTLPTALPGILTGVMLSVARAAGETAPLLFTALFSNYWLLDDRNQLQLNDATASMAVLIYNFSNSFVDNQKEMAWSASLVLVLGVLVTNLIGKSLSRGGPTR